ncbi:MAG: imidazole glycerol phosphate synthase subunit HisH [Clostridia bacterium]|nr:imidazole glycerol phosphate synthase subunit HisH [Clostridia bacterium]
MIAVINYGTGNIRSVANALKRLGLQFCEEAGEAVGSKSFFCVTDDPDVIRRADHVILPGVGEAARAMEQLRLKGLDDVIRSLTCPVLGICIGMQLMCRRSAEGDVSCLGIFPADVVRLPSSKGLKIPHVGWNTVKAIDFKLFHDLALETYFYYVHSYAAELCSNTSAVTEYGIEFSAAMNKDNFYGTQFHPEKSGSAGRILLKNFLEL